MQIAGFIRYSVTVLAGAIVPLIVLLALFLAGEPPAIIALWERGEVRVTAHETVLRDTGYGIVEFVETRAIGPDGEPRLLRIADDPAGEGAARLFPVGSTAAARLSPGGHIAWPDGETGLFTFAAFTAAPLVLFIALGIVLRPVIALAGLLVPALAARQTVFRAVFGKAITLLCVLAIPLFVTGLFWSVGEAPALRWFAPVEQAQIRDTRVEPAEDGQRWHASVQVEAPGLAFIDLRGAGGAFREREQAERSIAHLAAGQPLRVRVYRHRPYAMRIYAFDFAVIAASLAALFIMLTGLLTIARPVLQRR